MRKIHALSLVAAMILLASSHAVAQEPVRWQPTLETAKQLAAQSQRLVLIHFWADWCQPCQRMEQEVFAQPAVGAAIQANYVPVKINQDHFPQTSRQFGVTALPADVIITPQGQPIAKFQGFSPATAYISQLDQVAATMRQTPRTNMYAQAPAGSLPVQTTPPSMPIATPAAPNGPAFQPAAVQPPVALQANTPGLSAPTVASQSPAQTPTQRPLAVQQAPPVAYPPMQVAGVATPNVPVPTSPPASPVSPASPPAVSLPLGLDGFCPVQLTDDMANHQPKWTLGDRRWGAVHRGRTYLFSSPEHQRRFFADPDRFAPVLSGSDVVMAIERGQTVSGRREHGILYCGRIYLFADEQSLQQFSQKPDYYAQLAQQGQHPAATPPQGTAAHPGAWQYR